MNNQFNGCDSTCNKTRFKRFVYLILIFTSFNAAANFLNFVPQLSTNEHAVQEVVTAFMENKTIVLEIAQFNSALNDMLKPDVIIQKFSSDNAYHEDKVYPASKPSLSASYQVASFVNNQTTIIINNWFENFSLSITYLFNSNTSGTWLATLSNDKLLMSGNFILSDSKLTKELHLAEFSHSNLTVAVNINNAQSNTVPKHFFPDRAVVLQSYDDDGKYKAIGFGPKAIPHHGTYTYEKISANVAIERTIQIMPNSTAPFVMIYFYDTSTTGRFFQNFGNGSIYFSGLFSTFETVGHK